MRDGFEQYRAELDGVRLTENEKAALLQTLTEREPAQRPVRVLRTALIAACVCLALVGTVFAAEWVRQQVTTATGAELTFWYDEEGHELYCWGNIDPVSQAPVKIRDGRMWFVAGGQELDITDRVDADTPYIYETTLEDGRRDCIIVGGTPEDYGYVELPFFQDGHPLGMSGCNYSWTEILKEGEREYIPPTEDSLGMIVITGEKSVTHYSAWFEAAVKQLGFADAASIFDWFEQ